MLLTPPRYVVLMMPRLILYALSPAALVVLHGCQTPRSHQSGVAEAERVDSIVLERTLCYGTCPAYRLSVDRDGVVRFASRNPGDSLSATDTVPALTLDSLAALADRTAFHALPDRIDRQSPTFCPDYATDHPAMVVSMYGSRSKTVHYYTGCYLRSDHTAHAALIDLRRLAAAMDSATGAKRWIRPARRR